MNLNSTELKKQPVIHKVVYHTKQGSYCCISKLAYLIAVTLYPNSSYLTSSFFHLHYLHISNCSCPTSFHVVFFQERRGYLKQYHYYICAIVTFVKKMFVIIVHSYIIAVSTSLRNFNISISLPTTHQQQPHPHPQ